ncbi:MAG TPA: hypothetical protein PKL30_19185 [Leptospiraceae bacterium]|nr:hypothetical protein [Leptospiraceae bacterium]HNF57471.1 hypothetical protein [Leptospiraceae bacterium]HNM92181.1 hypothetical protein [Leptospiraceae bacterium]HNN81023.1 hypothetical protein [Leptospiraceae bacterium]
MSINIAMVITPSVINSNILLMPVSLCRYIELFTPMVAKLSSWEANNN